MAIASAYTMVHWTNYYGWARERANTELAALFGGVVFNLEHYSVSASVIAPLTAETIHTLNSANPGLSTNKNQLFHFSVD